MSEVETVLDELEDPAPKPTFVSVVSMVSSIAAAIGTVIATDKATGGKLAPADYALISSVLVAALAQVVTFIMSFRKNKHHVRAVGYVKGWLEDCKAQEEEPTGMRIAGTGHATTPMRAQEEHAAEDMAADEAPEDGKARSGRA